MDYLDCEELFRLQNVSSNLLTLSLNWNKRK